MYSFIVNPILLFRPTYRPAQAGAVGWAGSLLGELGCAVGECWESFAKSPNEDNPARGDLDISSNGLMGERWVLLLVRGSALGAAI
jgi:hypothetical protein